MQGLFFYIFATGAVFCALVMVTRKDAVTSAFALVACFLNIAAIFATMSAHFMAVLQVLVYAGAIMVFFLFVTMFIGRSERFRSGSGVVIPLVGTVSVLTFAWLLLRFLRGGSGETFPPVPGSYGGIGQVSELLLTDYIFLFEVTGLLLLVAVIGAVLLARRVTDPVAAADEAEADAREGGASHA